MPFQKFVRNGGIFDKDSHHFIHAAWERCSGIGDTVAQCVAETDFYVNFAFFPQFHQLNGKRNTEAVNVRAGNVFKMAAFILMIFIK
jgi:hypothetical protein